MRHLIVFTAALALVSFAASAQTPANSNVSIPAQNSPLQSKPSDPTIKETGGKAKVVTSPLIKEAPLKSDHVMGSRKAPVVMVEYASLSCPHCAHFSTTVLPEIEKKYIQTGKVAYVLRQFPLNEPALRGAMLVDCVGESSEEKYFTFVKVLFDSQSKWAFDGNFLSGLETIATVGGVSKAQFGSCMNSKEREMKVLQDKKTANDELQVPHTPYILLNGTVYEGGMSVEAFSAAIDAELAKTKK